MSIERSLKLYKGLVEVSALLVAITDFTELLSAILDVARRVMDAEASSLFLAQGDGSLRLVIASGTPSPPNPPVIVPRGKGIAGWTLEHRKSELVEDAYADPRFYRKADEETGFKTRSMLCGPLIRGETEIGVLQVLNPVGKKAFESLDLEAFDAFVNLAATAIEKVRALDRQRDQDRMNQELALAHEIQTSLLPQRLPVREGLVFATKYRAARNIGGDFYDVVEIGDDELFFVIGDVSGKGIPAALLMAQAMSLLRLIIQPGISPASALCRWNTLLCGHTIHGMFITATVGRIVPSRREVTLATAGHCNPVLLRAKQPTLELDLNGAPPLGVLPECRSTDTQRILEKGDCLLLYTDGLTESKNLAGDFLGLGGFFGDLEAWKHESAERLLGNLVEREESYRKGREPGDDLTLLVFGFR